MAVSSPDLKAFLVATPFFGGLSDASLDLLISMLVERRFDVGATVVEEGEQGRSMYIVHSGELVVTKLGDSGRVIRMTGLGPEASAGLPRFFLLIAFTARIAFFVKYSSR